MSLSLNAVDLMEIQQLGLGGTGTEIVVGGIIFFISWPLQ